MSPVMRAPVSPLLLLTGAAAIGAIAGAGSLFATTDGRDQLAATTAKVGVVTGMRRARQPQPGDHWSGCNDVRAAGAAPLYEGEPGYREDMDGDGDGIACEPIRQ